VIDLHCHSLPGLDDGPSEITGAIDVARAAVAAGTQVVVATPHVREDYPYDLALIDARADELRTALRADGVPLQILTAGEVAITHVHLLDEDALAGLCLGQGRYLLLESPYGRAPDMLEHGVFDLQMRGFNVVLAHPERSTAFQADSARLAGLVDAGVLTSITAGSMAGRFGSTVQEFTVQLFRDRLVHGVASDAHDVSRRPPGLLAGFEALERHLRGVSRHAQWFTQDAPRAIVEGSPVPEPPRLSGRAFDS